MASLEVNERARSILRHRDGLSDRDGMLRARAPDQVRLERLVDKRAAGLRSGRGQWVDAAPPLRPCCRRSWCTSSPWASLNPTMARGTFAALVLIVEPGRQHRVNPKLVATTLELTPAETQVAVWLAEGRSVRDMVEATGRTQSAIYWHLQQMYSVTGCSIGFRQWKWDRNGPGRREVTAVARCALRRLSIMAGRFCRMGTVSLPGWRGLQAGLAGRTATPGGARPAGLLRWRPRKRGTRPERTLRTAASVLWAFPSVRRRNPRVAGAGGCGRLGVR